MSDIKNYDLSEKGLEKLSTINGLDYQTIKRLIEANLFNEKKLRMYCALIDYWERVKKIQVNGHDGMGCCTYEQVIMDSAWNHKVSESTLKKKIYG